MKYEAIVGDTCMPNVMHLLSCNVMPYA